MGNMKAVFDATRQLCGKPIRRTDSVRSKEGILLTKEEEVKKRWKEHFAEALNRPPPTWSEVESEAGEPLEIETGLISHAEIRTAINQMKNGKAGGVDGMTTELMKADLETTVAVLYELLLKIWESERVPNDWRCGFIIRLPKKGNLMECGNWRGIILLPVAEKVLGKVIITRIRDTVDTRLRQEQAGFRRGRGTIEQIFILRNIIEQVMEWNANLYVCFVDFEKAFDSIDRGMLWEIMREYSIPSKLITMVKAMYEQSKCAVVDGSGGYDWFDVKTGVKQGCCMSGFLFLLVIDWVMRRTIEGRQTGIRWQFENKLEDLDFADDVALVASRIVDVQTKVESLNINGKKTGLKIHLGKTVVMKWNVNPGIKIQLEGNDIDEVEKFVYLGVTVTTTGGAGEDISARLGKTQGVFCNLKNIWKNSQLSINTKLMIFFERRSAVGKERWRFLSSPFCSRISRIVLQSCFVFCVSVYIIMGNEPLTRKILEEILDVKLSPLKATIKELTDKMAEFRTCKFIDEANTKYEETNTRMSGIETVFSTITTENKALNNTILRLEEKITNFKKTCNELEQYSRRECLEINGIPLPPKERNIKENANELVIKIGDKMGVPVGPEDISVRHRIPTSQKYQGKRSAPAIIVKFTRRDTKEMFYLGRKELRGLTTKDFGYTDENNIFINESLTEANKELFKATLKVKKDYKYDYIWTTNGKIYLRKDRDSSAILIKKEGELDKLKR